MLKAKILGFEVVYDKNFTHLDENALRLNALRKFLNLDL